MARFQYLKVDGPTEIYDVARSGEMLGMVWQRAGIWYADRYSMGDPKISGADREEVTDKLDLAQPSR